jgi:glycosyltransferase EpsD
MKVLYVATVASHICQFHLPYLETFQKSGAEVHVAAKNNLAEKNGLQLKFVDKYFDIPFSRSPIAKSNISAYKQLKKVILENNYDYIVCNTPTGGILTRLAARKARKSGSKVIYIAHGFHFYKGAPLKNWLIFYPIEYLFAPLCDILVTINKEDYLYATKHFKTTVRHIHGIGVSTDKYHPVYEQEIAQLRKNLNLQSNDYVILCTGELNKNKNQTQLINAASLLKDKISNLKILLAGNGPNEQSLRTQIKELELQDIVTLLGYRTDLEKIVPAVNLIVSCSRREGLPLNIVEAML